MMESIVSNIVIDKTESTEIFNFGNSDFSFFSFSAEIISTEASCTHTHTEQHKPFLKQFHIIIATYGLPNNQVKTQVNYTKIGYNIFLIIKRYTQKVCRKLRADVIYFQQLHGATH